MCKSQNFYIYTLFVSLVAEKGIIFSKFVENIVQKERENENVGKGKLFQWRFVFTASVYAIVWIFLDKRSITYCVFIWLVLFFLLIFFFFANGSTYSHKHKIWLNSRYKLIQILWKVYWVYTKLFVISCIFF